MNKLNYVVGNVITMPFTGTLFIPHCCNDMSVMGAGVAKALYMKWPKVRDNYISQRKLTLGDCYIVPVEPKINVVNMIGQHEVMIGKKNGISVGKDGFPPVRYSALVKSMTTLRDYILDNKIDDAVIHSPKFGSDLAGGDWSIICILIREIWLDICPVTICVLDKSQIPVTV